MARRTAVLISGRGSNLAALLAARTPEAAATIVLVVSDKAKAGGLAHAVRAGVPTALVTKDEAQAAGGLGPALDRLLDEAAIDLVCLAGFMRILPTPFVQRWRNRLLNIHPSLLPAFPGLDTHTRVLAAGLPVSGCTVHMVRPEVDTGPVLAQGVVPVLAGDDTASLAARVLEAEHALLPRTLELVAQDRLPIVGERVEPADSAAAAARLWRHPALTAPP